MTENLKPCPFCGSLNVSVFSSFGDPTTDENIMNVECINCGAQGVAKSGVDNAVAAWNKRAGGGAINSELFVIVKSLAESDNYSRCKEIRQNARQFIQRMKAAQSK